MKPGTPLLRSTRLLDQVSERIRYRHYSLRTKKAYLYWVRFFIRWSATQPGRMRNRWGARWAKAALGLCSYSWSATPLNLMNWKKF